jgi:hypothetical protein
MGPMTDWSWITTDGAVGELPVRILPDRRAEFLKFVEGVVLDYETSAEDPLEPGDECILTAKIVDAKVASQPARIRIDVLDVEFLQRSGGTDSEIEEMMRHLEGARERRERERRNERCENCATIDSSTDLSAKTEIGDRDLHYCATCGRLLSSDEYEQWKSANRQ